MITKDIEVSEVEMGRMKPRVDSITKYKNLIIKNWNKSREAIIKVGQILIEAKEKLSDSKAMESWAKVVAEELPFTKRTADRLIKIAQCEYITSGEYDDCLPVSWGTLHSIATMGEAKFKMAVNDKTITPDVTRETIDLYHNALNETDDSGKKGQSNGYMTIGNITIEKELFKVNKKIDYDAIKLLIENSSGNNILDDAARNAVKNAGPFPPIPEKLNKQYVLLELPISFILR